MTKSKPAIAFFDFDGTITSKDSLFDFVKYAVGKRRFYAGMLSLSPMLAAHKLHVISSHAAKERFMSHFFADWDESEFRDVADRYSLERIDRIARPAALRRIAWHQSQGHEVVVVSASLEDWLKKWCVGRGVGLIATRMEARDGRLTGKFATRNCSGAEKASRIRERYDLAGYQSIFAYGDSPGDKHMLQLSSRPHYRAFS